MNSFKLVARSGLMVVMMTAAMMVTMFSSASPVVAASTAQPIGLAAIDCSQGRSLCVDVQESDDVFGHYVGHDEPAALFYSNTAGSGNSMRYELTLPKDPVGPAAPGKSFNFQLHPAFWFGVAMCDTQSDPNQVSTCTPDSDSNITSNLAQHPGTAFTELQFYPPGWVKQFTGQSCDARQWCAALNIDSLSRDPVHGLLLNNTCASSILGGTEYVNFAYVTKSGHPQGPPNPVQVNATSVTPDPNKDLFMKQGDHLVVTMHDTAHGLKVEIVDTTTGQSGSMTASAANGFGQVKFAPAPSTECTNIPYDFHPMYSTSSEKTRVPWAAHTYNVAFSDEIGHFDYCSAIGTSGSCVGNEGAQGNTEPADADDNACLPASASLLIQVTGCVDSNTGFDGSSYQRVWPDGNTRLHPTPIRFSSPLTGKGYGTNYQRMGFEADLPAIEGAAICNILTGAGCTRIPSTDDGVPATFYPFFSISKHNNTCSWLLGNDIPGVTTNDFGKNAQYGALFSVPHLIFGGGGATRPLFADYRQVLAHNPCSAS